MNDTLGAILAILVIWLVIKFAFGGGQSPSDSSRPATAGAPGTGMLAQRMRPVSQEMVDTVQAMFPHIPAASIRYDLQRTGSVEVTCDHILREGALPPPPAGLFADANPAPQPPTTAGPSTSSPGSGSVTSSSLISRLHLESRLSAGPDTASSSNDADHGAALSGAEGKGKGVDRGVVGWAESAKEREAALKERKAKMVLEARRKLLEKQERRRSTEEVRQSDEGSYIS